MAADLALRTGDFPVIMKDYDVDAFCFQWRSISRLLEPLRMPNIPYDSF